jgi:hypothetical protein
MLSQHRRSQTRFLAAIKTLLLSLCACSIAGIAHSQTPKHGPLDDLRQDFIDKSRTHSFQISQVRVTGKILSIDSSRSEVFRELVIKNPASRQKLGDYVESVELDDGQSQAKAYCSAFQNDRQRQNSLLDPKASVAIGQAITVNATFFGSYRADSVELLNCSLIPGETSSTASSANPAQPPPTPAPVETHNATGAVSTVSLLAEAKGDMLAFRQKYAGRSVTLTGAVDWTYGTAVSTTHGVVLRGKFHEDGDVFCDFLPSEINSLKQLSPDQLITVAGRFDPRRVYWDDEARIKYSHNRDVKLTSCRIVDLHASAPPDMQFPEPKPLGPSSPPLSGLYMSSQLRVQPGFSSRTDWYFYFFSPDGHVFSDCPKNGNLDRFDFAAAVKTNPRSVGYYRVSGNRIDFVWFAGRKPESSQFTQNGAALSFLGSTWNRADTDPSKFRPNWLVGTYRFQSGASLPNVAGQSVTSYTWRADGTFTTSASSAVLNGAVPQANRSHAANSGGTYTLSGTTLTLNFSDGRVERHTVFPAGPAIFFDGSFFISGK